MDGVPVMRSGGDRQLQRPQAGPALLGHERLERLGGGSEEEGLVDVTARSDQGAVGRHDSDRPIVHRLIEARAGPRRQHVSARRLCFALLAPVTGNDLVLEGVDHRVQLSTLHRELLLDLLEPVDRLGELLLGQLR